MVLIKEFRIVSPFTLDEYQRGQRYSVARTSKEATTGSDGVEVLVNEPFEDPETGRKGIYTFKIYHLQGYVPGWLKTVLPKSAMKLEEKAWDAFPHCKTVLTSPFLGDKFSFSIETVHFENDRGEQPNVHKLNQEQLKNRVVHYWDIATDELQDVKLRKPEEDPKLYKSKLTGRGPLAEGWRKECQPVMCAYKLVTMKCKIWGLQNKFENFLMNMEGQIFLRFHKQLFCWQDDWYSMTLQQLLEKEKEMFESMGKLIQQHQKESPVVEVRAEDKEELIAKLEEAVKQNESDINVS